MHIGHLWAHSLHTGFLAAFLSPAKSQALASTAAPCLHIAWPHKASQHWAQSVALYTLSLQLAAFCPPLICRQWIQGYHHALWSSVESKLDWVLHRMRGDHIAFHCLKKGLSGRYAIICHGNSWWKGRCYKYVYKTEVIWEASEGYFTMLYIIFPLINTSFYYFLLYILQLCKEEMKKAASQIQVNFHWGEFSLKSYL